MKTFVVFATLLCLSAAQQTNLQDLLERIRERLNQGNAATTTTITPSGQVIDTIHNWRLEDHQTSNSHILLFISDTPDTRKCYVIEVSRTWTNLLHTEDNVYRISEEIYALVNDPNHREHLLRTNELIQEYRDFTGAQECQGHLTYEIRYTPSFLSAP
ncbi:uncharacterized protein LOC112563193 [Pomacea canaliculata]|uniref:uncharacterized protein LOC112563193 n=1 Tax=Pomacea canaliculata TaxID=400727 RepID=UPI000D73A8A6|nr:uncharacterized protein LOC112563193 [Pomacea canaliculata]